jgi:predicted DCC family thiol-disulfide oxidoreductase YuxK
MRPSEALERKRDAVIAAIGSCDRVARHLVLTSVLPRVLRDRVLSEGVAL